MEFRNKILHSCSSCISLFLNDAGVTNSRVVAGVAEAFERIFGKEKKEPTYRSKFCTITGFLDRLSTCSSYRREKNADMLAASSSSPQKARLKVRVVPGGNEYAALPKLAISKGWPQ